MDLSGAPEPLPVSDEGGAVRRSHARLVAGLSLIAASLVCVLMSIAIGSVAYRSPFAVAERAAWQSLAVVDPVDGRVVPVEGPPPKTLAYHVVFQPTSLLAVVLLAAGIGMALSSREVRAE